MKLITFEHAGRTFRVVGVVPDVSIARQLTYAEVWFPMGTRASSAYREELMEGHIGYVKLRSPADKEAAQQEFRLRLQEVELPPGFDTVQSGLDTPLEGMSRELLSEDYSQAKPYLLIAIVVAGAVLFMVLPAINLANLGVSRALERSEEIGVRKAFGATRGQLVRQLLFENLVLTALGGIISVPFAWMGLQVFNGSELLSYFDLHLNLNVLAWGMAATAVFSVLSGIYPAWRLSRKTPAEAMRGRLS